MRRNLPRGYYRELPKLALRELAGDARVYAMAVELIRHSDSRLDRQQLVRFMNSYQAVAPLTIGELWAWPSMLKLALIENLRRLAEETLEARAARRAADAYVARIDAAGAGRAAAAADAPARRLRRPAPAAPARVRAAAGRRARRRRRRTSPPQQTTSEDAIRSEHQRQAAAQVSVANVITSLRLCSTLDWSQYFEAVSLVERVLQRDPAGAYARMDFLSRDRYRQAVEELAEPTGEAQLRVALRAVESARQAAESGAAARSRRPRRPPPHRQGPARPRDRPRLSSAPRPTRCGASSSRHATAVYLGSIAPRDGAAARASGWPTLRGQRRTAVRSAGVALLLLLPASDLAIAFVQRLAARWSPPRRLPRLEFAAGIPDERAHDGRRPHAAHQRGRRSTELLEHLEVLALGNLDPHIHFAILERLRRRARARHAGGRGDPRRGAGRDRGAERALGASTPTASTSSIARASGTRAKTSWMGWERKRGKLEEFNRLLRGATDTSFTVQVGDAEILPERPLLPHARLRHAAAARRREEAHRHHRPPAEPPALRRARWAASPRATGSCSRASA